MSRREKIDALGCAWHEWVMDLRQEVAEPEPDTFMIEWTAKLRTEEGLFEGAAVSPAQAALEAMSAMYHDKQEKRVRGIK